MNYRQKHKQNEKLIVLYDAYLNEETIFFKRLKLYLEIARLKNQNDQIELMPVKDYGNDTNDFVITVNCVLT